MKKLKENILKLSVEKIKKVAYEASGEASLWNMYQPKEPKILKK